MRKLLWTFALIALATLLDASIYGGASAGDIVASGTAGGPISPASFQYQLQSSTGTVTYSITGAPSWLDVTSNSGTATTSPTTVTFTVNASASSLSPGTYGPTTITFTNVTNGQGTQTRTATLTVNAPPSLVITPATSIFASGLKGGPFTPSSFQYQLSASSGTINYSISGLPAWLTASSSSGTLTTSPTNVTFTVNSNANSLLSGSYNAVISFANTTNGQGNQTRSAALTVNSGGGGSSLFKTYVSGRTGNDTGLCPTTAPCATLNYALSVTGVGGQVTILDGGLFGPIKITQSVTIEGSKADATQIVADPSAQVGCIGALPSSCGLTNNGYAVEIAAGINDSVKILHVFMGAGPSGGAGALMFTSGGTVQLSGNVYRGNGTATGPIIALYPNNPGTSEAQVYFSNSDVGFSNGGAVLVAPSGSNNFKIHFDHMEVHNAAFGVTEDATGLTSGNNSRMVISESKFFSLSGSAVTVLTSAVPGTGGEADSALRRINIFNAGGAAINADGAQSQLVLSNSTITGNNIGLKSSNGAVIATSANNTIQGNGTNVSGPQSPSEVTGSVNLGPPAP